MSALWTPADFSAATGAAAPGFSASGVSIDSRSVAPGDLFVALETETGDGHRFAAAALARGASGALVRMRPEGVDPARLLVVGDTLAGLADLGRFARARFTGQLAAITGSVGKTTTKEMLRRILAAFGPTHAAQASYNNQWGLPLTLARMPAVSAYAVAEIGMNHAGEIAPLARLARPHLALITTIGTAHIGHLGSIEAIADEKAAIAQGLEPGGIFVLPGDSPLLGRLQAAACGHRLRHFGSAAGMDGRLVALAADAAGTTLEAEILGTQVRLRIAAPGAHMAMNATAALLAAGLLGIAPRDAAAALEGFAPVDGRGAQRSIPVAGGRATLLDESYNASTIAVRAALAVLRLVPGRRRVVVLGDMREMGAAGPAEHLSLVDDVAATADLVFACGPLTGLLHAALPVAIRGAHTDDSAALAPLVAAALRDGDAVLVKGSLGMKMKTIVQTIDPATEGTH